MSELQEASENMLFCPAERGHPGAVDRAAKRGGKAHDQLFAKVVTRIVCPGIGKWSKAARKMSMRGTNSKRVFHAQESILPQTARPLSPPYSAKSEGIGCVRLKVM